MDPITPQGNGGQEPQEPNAPQAQEPGFDPNKRIEELTQALEHERSSKAGETRKNSELNKIVLEMRETIAGLQNSLKEKMTDSEKSIYEQQRKDEEMKSLKAEVEELRKTNRNKELKELKLQVLADNDLDDINLVNMLAGESIEDFSKNVKLYVERENKKQEKIKMDLMNGTTPAGGQAQSGAKEIKRTDFDKLHPLDQRLYVKEGGKILD